MLELEEKNIVNRGEIKREELVAVSKGNMLKSTRSFSYVGIVIVVLSLILLASAFITRDNLILMYAIVLFVAGGLIVGLPFIMMLFMPNIAAKQNKGIIDGFIYKYVFSNDKIEITLISDDTKNRTSLKYSLIYKTMIYGDIAVIYLNSSVVYMFKLSGFENEEDKNWVMTKIDKKYKVKNND